MKEKRVVLARRNDDAGRVELLAATQVGRPGLQDRAVDIIEGDRPRAQYYLSFRNCLPRPRSIAPRPRGALT